jgi:transposase
MSSPGQLSVPELVAIIEQQAALIEQQARTIEKLERRIAELERQLEDKGPSDPPGFVKANRKKRPAGDVKKPRKKRSTNHARKLEEPTERVIHTVDNCPDCGRKLSDGWEQSKRQVIDVPFVPYIVREHVAMGHHCGVCGKDHIAKPDLSGEVVGQHRVSLRVMALVAYLKTECRMPIRQVQQVLQALYGLRLSEGTLVAISRKVADLGRGVYEELRQELRSSPVVHADETGWREDGINGYLWAFLTKTLQFFVRDQSRGSAVPMEVLGEFFEGILVSDFYSGYGPLQCAKQRCWVHLLRDLEKLVEDHPGKVRIANWAGRIRGLYGQAMAYRSEQLAYRGEVTMALRTRRRKARRKFERELMKLARRYIPKESDPRHVLSKRIEKFRYEMFVFVEHPEVSPDNNAAERGLRPSVIHRKVCGGTRSSPGSETMAILRSLFGTWRMRGQSPLAACMEMLASAPA